MQRPIPYWEAAISETFFARYGKLGWPILTFPVNQPSELLKAQLDTYRRVSREYSHDPARMRIALTMFMYVAEDADEAHTTFERGMADYFGFLYRTHHGRGAGIRVDHGIALTGVEA